MSTTRVPTAPLHHYAGDDYALVVTVEDSAGAAVDITGWLWVLTLTAADGTSLELTVAHGDAGAVTFSAAEAALVAFVAGSHRWDLKRGDTNTTLAAGLFVVDADVSP